MSRVQTVFPRLAIWKVHRVAKPEIMEPDHCLAWANSVGQELKCCQETIV